MPLVRLAEIAMARSGDKGGSANIGVVARSAGAFDFLRDTLTAEKVAEFFAELSPQKVTRYELPNISALNFVLVGVLGGAGGGGSVSLRIDAQGKTLGQALLEMKLQVPRDILGATHE